jgi:hypothetical protein
MHSMGSHKSPCLVNPRLPESVCPRRTRAFTPLPAQDQPASPDTVISSLEGFAEEESASSPAAQESRAEKESTTTKKKKMAGGSKAPTEFICLLKHKC